MFVRGAAGEEWPRNRLTQHYAASLLNNRFANPTTRSSSSVRTTQFTGLTKHGPAIFDRPAGGFDLDLIIAASIIRRGLSKQPVNGPGRISRPDFVCKTRTGRTMVIERQPVRRKRRAIDSRRAPRARKTTARPVSRRRPKQKSPGAVTPELDWCSTGRTVSTSRGRRGRPSSRRLSAFRR